MVAMLAVLPWKRLLKLALLLLGEVVAAMPAGTAATADSTIGGTSLQPADAATTELLGDRNFVLQPCHRAHDHIRDNTISFNTTNTSTTFSITATIHREHHDETSNNECFSTEQSLRDAINALTSTTSVITTTTQLSLCAGTTLVLHQPLRIHQRSVTLICATVNTNNNNNSYNETCILQGSGNHRLLELVGNDNRETSTRNIKTPTIVVQGLTFQGGEYYHDMNTNPEGGGAAIWARGVHVVVEDCVFRDNVAQGSGGAIFVQDDINVHVLFLVTRSTFRENLDMADDCHSVYFQQDHARSLAELNTEWDHGGHDNEQRHGTLPRRLQYQAQYYRGWDDPAHAAQTLQQYKPAAGVTLCV